MIEADKDPKMLEELIQAQKAIANNDIPEEQLITKEKVKRFAQLSFSKQYAEGMSQAGEITAEMREETRGEWKKYQQETDPTALWSSLQNKGTAWCTKGFATAKTQLEGGDFYVYYTLDKKGQATIPRLAIRMNGDNQIGEIRGLADSDQNIEANMLEIMEEKMSGFDEKEVDKYKKKSADMKYLTEITDKVKKEKELTKDDLRFLYEMDEKIQGFGYKKDPRIKEILDNRNIKEDLAFVLDFKPEQISTTTEEFLNGEDIVYHHGNLDLDSLEELPENIKFPETVNGNLYFGSLTELPENFEFLKTVRGLYFGSLTELPENFEFPKTVNGYLDLRSLTGLPDDVKFPETVQGKIYVGDLSQEQTDELQNKYPNLTFENSN